MPTLPIPDTLAQAWDSFKTTFSPPIHALSPESRKVLKHIFYAGAAGAIVILRKHDAFDILSNKPEELDTEAMIAIKTEFTN